MKASVKEQITNFNTIEENIRSILGHKYPTRVSIDKDRIKVYINFDQREPLDADKIREIKESLGVNNHHVLPFSYYELLLIFHDSQEV